MTTSVLEPDNNDFEREEDFDFAPDENRDVELDQDLADDQMGLDEGLMENAGVAFDSTPGAYLEDPEGQVLEEPDLDLSDDGIMEWAQRDDEAYRAETETVVVDGELDPDIDELTVENTPSTYEAGDRLAEEPEEDRSFIERISDKIDEWTGGEDNR